MLVIFCASTENSQSCVKFSILSLLDVSLHKLSFVYLTEHSRYTRKVIFSPGLRRDLTS